MFLSSHLLDEVEKACDAAAIVDGGRVLMQGPISEIATDGMHGRRRVQRPRRGGGGARRAPGLTAITRTADGPAADRRRGRPPGDPGVTRALVAAGIDVYRISPVAGRSRSDSSS